jgi:hypothetical protein
MLSARPVGSTVPEASMSSEVGAAREEHPPPTWRARKPKELKREWSTMPGNWCVIKVYGFLANYLQGF